MRQLILFTNGFPYGKNETFIENEIEFLSNNFRKVLIISISNEDIFSTTPRIPTGINNVSIFTCITKHRPIIYRILGLRYIFTYVKMERFSKMLSSLLVIGRLRYAYNSSKKVIKNFSKEQTIAYSYWLTLAPLTIWAKNNNKTIARTISRAHGYDLYSEMHPWNFEPIKLYCIRKLDYIYSCSKYGTLYLQNKYSYLCSKNKFITSYLGTKDLGIVENTINKNNIVLATCSNNSPVKNIPFFIKALSILKTHKVNFIWNCIGFDSDETINSLVNTGGIKNNCHFLGKISNNDVLDFYRKNKITYFVNVSKSEGIPVSIMEVQSFGIPVIASNVGGTSEIVNNNNGFLFETDISVEEFSEILLKAIEISEEDYQRKKNLSRKTWEEKSSAKTNYQSFINNIKK